MSRFVSQSTKKIELGNDEWVEVRESLAFDELLPITEGITQNNANDAKVAIPLLQAAIKSWNLKDDDGKDVPCTKENIKMLNTETVLALVGQVSDMYFPGKKGSAQSGE